MEHCALRELEGPELHSAAVAVRSSAVAPNLFGRGSRALIELQLMYICTSTPDKNVSY